MTGNAMRLTQCDMDIQLLRCNSLFEALSKASPQRMHYEELEYPTRKCQILAQRPTDVTHFSIYVSEASMAGEELVLDRKVRDWVVVPLTLCILLMMLLRQYVAKVCSCLRAC